MLSFLISSQWLIDEAVDEKLPVSSGEVERRLKARINAFPNGEVEFHEFLRVKRQTVSDVMFEIRAELASSHILQMLMSAEPRITQAQIAKYYSQQKQRFVTAEKRQVALVYTERGAAAERVKREVAGGRSMASEAQYQSLVYTRGLLHGGHENTLERAIFSAKADVLVGPVRVGTSRFVFEVGQIVPARQRTLAQVRNAIEKRLAREQRRRVLAAFVKTWRQKWIAVTSCDPGFVVQKCRQYKISNASPEEDPYALD